ncbi:MAG: hypothetical protein DRP82_00045 [Planctomycetota bacterium]|nr:MAG: hypothetical protein DRP82_00045 [Planctomycetota bacterium]
MQLATILSALIFVIPAALFSLTQRTGRIWFVFGLSFAVAFVEPSPTDVLVPLVVLYVILTRRISVRPLSLLPLLFMIPLISTCLSTPNSPSLNYTLITAYLVILCTVATTLREEEREQVFSGLVWAALINGIVLIIALLLRLTGAKAAWLFFRWACFRGLYKDQNVLVTLLVPALGIAVLKTGWRWKWIRVILIGMAVVATASRGGYISVLLTGSLVLVILFRQKAMTPALALLGGLLASACIFPFWGQVILCKIGKPIQSYDYGRLSGYYQAIKWGIAHPQGKYPLRRVPTRVSRGSLKVAGIKGGCEPAVKGEFSFSFTPHNLFLEALGFHGVIGVVVILILLVVAGANIICNLPTSTKALIFLVGVLVPAMFQPPLHWRTFWLALGIALSDFGGRKSRETSEDPGSK